MSFLSRILGLDEIEKAVLGSEILRELLTIKVKDEVDVRDLALLYGIKVDEGMSKDEAFQRLVEELKPKGRDRK